MIARIEKLDYEGRGITHVDGKVVFIPKTLPHEVVQFDFVLEKKKYAIGRVVQILEKSDLRIFSICPYSQLCGGCTFDIVSYDDSIRFKKEIVQDILKKNGITVPSFLVISSPMTLGYRNKVTLHVKDFQVGYYVEESHEFVPIQSCYLANSFIQAVIDDFSFYSFSYGEVMIRSNSLGEILLHIKTNHPVEIADEFFSRHKILGILINDQCIYGSSFLEEERKGCRYKVHADAFFQVNPYISEKILEDILPFLKSYDTVYDLYCGVGFFSIRISDYVKKVIGIEFNLNAVISARENAILNHKNNISFYSGKVEHLLEKITNPLSCILVDPPRSGLDKAVIHLLLEKSYPMIIYISCNIKSFVRDLNFLLSSYEITFFRVYDMFSYTKHFECVCVLKRK